MRMIVVVLLAACGRVGFDADRSDAAAGPPPLCGIAGGDWMLTPPALVADVNDLLVGTNPGVGDLDDFDPVFSESGLELYLSSNQSNTSFDLYTLRRTALTAPFTTVEPTLVPGVEFGFQPLASQDVAVISANFGEPTLDYWLGTELATGPTWTRSAISSGAQDYDARLGRSGLALYFVRGDDNDNTTRELYVASRTSLDADFTDARPLAELNSASSDASPVPVDDDTGMLFASSRDTAPSRDDLYLAARSGPDAAFGPPIHLEALASSEFDGEPAMFRSPDGTCELVFVSSRDGAFNLYRSDVVRR